MTSLLLIARTGHQAWLVLERFPDDPLVITPWHHHKPAGEVLGRLEHTNWRGLMQSLNAAHSSNRADMLRLLLLQAGASPQAAQAGPPEVKTA